MDWKNIFVTVIGIAIVVRLIFITTGPMTIEDKINKAGNWIVGLCLISISWALLNTVFGKAGTLFKGSGSGSTNDKPIIQIDKPKDESGKDKNVNIQINTYE